MSIQPFGPLTPVNPYTPIITSSRSIAYLSDGIYLFSKFIEYPHKNYGKHYGVVIKGHELLKQFGFYDGRTRVIHKTDTGIWCDGIETYDWDLIGQVPSHQISDALSRMQLSLMFPTNYNLFVDNCEHFARFITEGYKQSTQVQTAGFFTFGAVVLGLIFLSDRN